MDFNYKLLKTILTTADVESSILSSPGRISVDKKGKRLEINHTLDGKVVSGLTRLPVKIGRLSCQIPSRGRAINPVELKLFNLGGFDIYFSGKIKISEELKARCDSIHLKDRYDNEEDYIFSLFREKCSQSDHDLFSRADGVINAVIKRYGVKEFAAEFS